MDRRQRRATRGGRAALTELAECPPERPPWRAAVLGFSALRLLDIAEGSRERLPCQFSRLDRAGLQSPRPVRHARLSVPLETFVTLAAIQLAISGLPGRRLLSEALTATDLRSVLRYIGEGSASGMMGLAVM
jgi:hypothetical protein